MPLALTDSQLDTVYRCAGPLAPAVRPAFLELEYCKGRTRRTVRPVMPRK
jgi:hypothetical protein